MHVGAAQAVLGDLLTGDRADDVRAGDEHLRGLADHEDEVRQGRGVGRAARAGAEHHADLRDDAGRLGVALEDAAVAGQRRDAFLDTGARAVVQRDQRRTGLDGHVHDLVDLGGVRLAQRPAEDPEVVRVGEDGAAVDGAPARDHAVGVRLLRLQAEARRAVPPQRLDLVERALVQEQLDPLTRRELPLGTLRFGGTLAGASPSLLTDGVQFGDAPAGVVGAGGHIFNSGHVSTVRGRGPSDRCRFRTTSSAIWWAGVTEASCGRAASGPPNGWMGHPSSVWAPQTVPEWRCHDP